MAKKVKAQFEDMSKEELIKKCYTYKDDLRVTNEKIKSLNSELKIMKAIVSQMTLPHKLQVCMEETLSYMEEIERIKRKEKMKI